MSQLSSAPPVSPRVGAPAVNLQTCVIPDFYFPPLPSRGEEGGRVGRSRRQKGGTEEWWEQEGRVTERKEKMVNR